MYSLHAIPSPVKSKVKWHCVERIAPPPTPTKHTHAKDVHFLILGTCERITPDGWIFAGVIRVKNFGCGGYPGLSRWVWLTSWVLSSGEPLSALYVARGRGRCGYGRRVKMIECFWLRRWRKRAKVKEYGGPQGTGKVKDTESPLKSRTQILP